MAKQRLEKDLSKTLKHYYKDIYYIKLHNQPLSHQTSPADYIILTKNNNILIECKQCKSKRFEFSRLTQLTDLLLFEKVLDKNESYLLLMFYKTRLGNSDIFLIPIKIFKQYIDNSIKKSINNIECLKYFNNYKLNIKKGGFLDLCNFIYK